MGNFARIEVPPTIPGPEKPVVAAPAPKAEAPAQRPDYIPEKFWKDGKADLEGMAKSYAELERLRGEQKPAEKPAGEPPKVDGEQKPDEKPAGEQPPVPHVVPGVTPQMQESYTKELQEGGQLSEKSYAELAKLGYSKQMVDVYIAGSRGQAALAAEKVVSLKAIAGGEEGYSAMTSWAATNLTPAEIQAYDKAVNSGDVAQVELAVRGLHAKYSQVNPAEPSLMGGRGGQVAGDVFSSTEQVRTAMSDRRYRTDPAYRQEVAEKLARSNVF